MRTYTKRMVTNVLPNDVMNCCVHTQKIRLFLPNLFKVFNKITYIMEKRDNNQCWCDIFYKFICTNKIPFL